MEKSYNSYDYDTIIIGAGMGGLAAGNILVKQGYRVLIVEKHFNPGGYCTNFKRKNYTFDSSLHMLNGCEEGGMIHNVLKKFGAENSIEFIKLKELFHWKCSQNDLELIVAPKIDEFIKQLTELFPNEAKNIKKFYKKYLKVYKFMISWTKKGIIGRISIFIRYFMSFIHFVKILNKTVSEILDPYIRDTNCKNLITILGGFFGLGPDEMSASIFIAGIFSYYLEGAYYPKGGSGTFSQSLADIYTSNGGDLKLSTEVIRIDLLKKLYSGVTVSDNSGKKISYTCRTIIANCDITEVVTRLCPQDTFPQRYQEKILNRRPGFSAVCIYIGINLDLNAKGFKDYELWITRSIKEQTTEELREIARNLRFSQFPSTAISIYSNIDPSCCPIGKTVLSSIYYALPEPFIKAIEKDGGKRGENYKKLKSNVEEEFIETLESVLNIPDLRKFIEVIEIATPITLNRYTSNRNGSFIGWEMTPDQMMLKQIPQKTPIPNLFLAGAWTMPAGGVATVLYSGDTCSVLVDKYIQKAIKKS
ncbi:MAG: phytoene desaturase family protein [Promethearchaeota archaeon]|jgi:prolycopene isomerase